MSNARLGRSGTCTKLCATALLFLALSPFTAPFQTFDLADASNAHTADEASIVTPPTLASTSFADAAGSLVPTLTTQTGRLRLIPLSALDIANVVTACSFVVDFALPITPSPNINGLSISPTVLRV